MAKICSLKTPRPCERAGEVSKSSRRSPESVSSTVVEVEVEVSRIAGSWSRARGKEQITIFWRTSKCIVVVQFGA